jgi:acetate---CoA ligase (ADP-forming)
MLAIKSGRTSEGAKAASSHTGSLAGSDLAYDAIFGQSGILRVDTMNELFDSAFAFASQPAPRGKRIAIVTNAGGPGIIATDSVIRQGLELASLTDMTQQRLRECLPAAANVHNPVDVIGDAKHDRYEAAIKHVLADDGVDGVVVILTPTAMIDVKETAEIIPNAAKDAKKPLLCSFMGVVDVSVGVEYLEAHGMPNYIFPEYAVRAMSNMVKFGWLLGLDRREVRRIAADREACSQVIRRKLEAHGDYMLPANEAEEILACYGFPLLRRGVATTPQEAATAAEEVGFPVAMKILSPDIIHKFDAGGVKLKISSPAEAAAAFNEIIANVKEYKADAEIKGIQIEKMARGGVEVILGASRDPHFGPICMFGLGGTFVEVMKDVTFRLAPMWEVSADIMINSIKSYKLLKGVRGMPPSDIDAIKDCLLRLSQMVSNHPEIAELDINPLIVYPEGEGCVVADSRIKLTKTPIGP